MPDEVTEGTGSEATEGAFDLDAAVEEFATSAPDEWKSKASKIQSELKGLRSNYAPYRDAFEGVHENDRSAIMALAGLVKSGDKDGTVKWALEAAKTLSGDAWNDVVKGLTPEQVEAIAEEAADEAPSTFGQDDIQKMIAEAIKADRAERDAQTANIERQSRINSDFQELGYNVERTPEGRLKDFTTQQVAMLAINEHNGDIKAAHESYQKWLGDIAKDYLQKHQGDTSLLADGGTPVKGTDPDTQGMSPKERAQARINRLIDGAAS